MTCQATVYPYTFNNETHATRTEFASPEAARKYLDRMGRMDARPARAARLTVRTPASRRDVTLANFPRVDGVFRAL